MDHTAITFRDISAAQRRIRGHVVCTPLIESPALNSRAHGRVFIKVESLQRTGSFKFRGAINRLMALSAIEQARGIVAFSSGNHALAVSEAARALGCRAIVVMPEDAPQIKIDGARSRGAEVVLYDRLKDDREAIVRDLVEKTGANVVSPYDDPWVIAGQGTGAAEAIEQLTADYNVENVDQALVTCSGGGLAAGWAIALKNAYPSVKIHTVEPDLFDDMSRSLESGRWESNNARSGTICDALQVATPGKLTLPILRSVHATGLTVFDDDVRDAIRFAAEELKLVLEPGGAAALAAVLGGKVTTADRNTLVIVSGGNVDLARFVDFIG